MEAEFEMSAVPLDEKDTAVSSEPVNNVSSVETFPGATVYFKDRSVYRAAEHGSFVDPQQPAPHPSYYYEKTFVATPARPALTNTSRLVREADARVAGDILDNSGSDLVSTADSAPVKDSKFRALKKKCCKGKATSSSATPPVRKKFGLWDGVVTTCLLNTFGVIMFLRVPWMVGNAGIWQAVLIIVICAILLLITTTSMSAIATNGKMKGGGAYFLISRSLGPQFGGVIGVLFSVGQAISVAFYLLGFAEALNATLESEAGFSLTGDPAWDIRVWAIIALVFILCMVLIGVGWIIKIQLAFLFLLMFVVLSVLIGTAIGPLADDGIPGNTTAFVGFSAQVTANNTNEAYLPGESFFSVFAVFFPAFTGLLAGANMSGDLRKPSLDIPRGTFIAILVASLTYIMLALLCGTSVWRTRIDGLGGLYFNSLIMQDMIYWSPLFLIGVFVATLSSGLAALAGAPRVAQAWAKDRIFTGCCIEPVEKVLAYGRSGSNDPIVGYLATFVIAFLFCLIGDLNTVAPIITQFFMITFALINLACFMGSIVKAPGWRPTFQLFNPWLSLVGAALCAVAMFLLSWWAALIAVGVGCVLYILLSVRPPPVQWGPTSHAYQISAAVDRTMELENIPFHAKTWRPHLLVLVKDEAEEDDLLIFAAQFSSGGGIRMGGKVIPGDFRTELPSHSSENILGYRDVEFEVLRDRRVVGRRSKLRSKKVSFFWSIAIAEGFRRGAQVLFFSSGLGKLRPNSVLLGFPESWRSWSPERSTEFMSVVRDAMEVGTNCMLARRIDMIPYRVRIPDRTIDIWWLVDDGGFTVLMPWLLSNAEYWSGSQLRILTVPGNASLDQVAHQTAMFGRLVDEFRIPATVHVELPDEMENDEFQQLLEGLRLKSRIVDSMELDRMCRYLRLAKLIHTESANADIIFCTLPFPPDEVASEVWLTWLNVLSDWDEGADSRPPFVFLRGNQQSLLSIYT